MFTGIIEELGTVKLLEKTKSLFRLHIAAPKISPHLQLGQSVSINGVCLTVVKVDQKLLTFEIMPETIKHTNLRFLKPQQKVNLERALEASGRIDGHFVTGHIDEIGTISKKKVVAKDVAIELVSPQRLIRHMVNKGSVALDGVSLSVSGQEGDRFSVNLIPYTLNNTTLGLKKEGDLLNIECDILAKYIDKSLSQNKQASASNLTPAFLQEHGFI